MIMSYIDRIEDDIQKVLNRFNVLKEVHAADLNFHAVCMNLTRNKEAIEDKAAELITKYGIKKALQKAKGGIE
jgi:hypothetical protein